jgi:hypothetical protein
MAGHYPLIRSGERVVCRREVAPIAAMAAKVKPNRAFPER